MQSSKEKQGEITKLSEVNNAKEIEENNRMDKAIGGEVIPVF